jgi:hypothetical protein
MLHPTIYNSRSEQHDSVSNPSAVMWLRFWLQALRDSGSDSSHILTHCSELYTLESSKRQELNTQRCGIISQKKWAHNRNAMKTSKLAFTYQIIIRYATS